MAYYHTHMQTNRMSKVLSLLLTTNNREQSAYLTMSRVTVPFRR